MLADTWTRRIAFTLAPLALAAMSLTSSTAAHAAPSPAPAPASAPVPLPPQLRNHPFATAKSGHDIWSWGTGSQTPGNCDSPDTGELSYAAPDAVLATNGQSGDCTDFQSPHRYPTADGYVYEIYAYASNWSQWNSFWMYGASWPADGEIDAVEGGSGTFSFLSYHYGNPGAYSSCNRSDGCSPALPLAVGPLATPGSVTNQQGEPDIAPGWHTIDIAFGGHGPGQGAISVWYDGKLYGEVWGTNVLNGGSQHDGMWLTWTTGSCDSAGNGSVCNGNYPDPGVFKVRWLRIFT